MEQLTAYLWIIFSILAIGGILTLVLLSKFFKAQPKRLPYTAVPLLTDAERRFFDVLEAALPHYCYLLAQVRLANLVQVQPGTGSFWKHFNPIGMKCVDFVIVQRDTMQPLLVVELDDRSHTRIERQHRDLFVDDVLASVAIPILHWPTQYRYNPNEIQRALNEKMQRH